MLKEIIEGVDYKEDFELVLFEVKAILQKLNSVQNMKIDAHKLQSIEAVKSELEKIIKK